MKYEFKINGEDKLELSAEGEKEQTLFNMVFPKDGEYTVTINSNSVIIKLKKNDL